MAQLQYEKQQIENQTAIDMANANAEKTRIDAQAEADKQIIAAKAEAESIVAVAEAQAEANRKIAASLTANLVEYEKVKSWDGVLLTVTGANSLIGIDLK